MLLYRAARLGEEQRIETEFEKPSPRIKRGGVDARKLREQDLQTLDDLRTAIGGSLRADESGMTSSCKGLSSAAIGVINRSDAAAPGGCVIQR